MKSNKSIQEYNRLETLRRLGSRIALVAAAFACVGFAASPAAAGGVKFIALPFLPPIPIVTFGGGGHGFNHGYEYFAPRANFHSHYGSNQPCYAVHEAQYRQYDNRYDRYDRYDRKHDRYDRRNDRKHDRKHDREYRRSDRRDRRHH